MFNTNLLSFFAKYGPNSLYYKIGIVKKNNIVRRRHRRNLKCRATPPSGQQEQQCVFFSFFFEGTKSLSAILNLQPGIEIHMQLFRRIKLRPFSFLPAFRRITPVRCKFWSLALLSTNHNTADQSKINSVFLLVERSVEGQNFNRIGLWWCNGKPE